jgi:hypothetical protein
MAKYEDKGLREEQARQDSEDFFDRHAKHSVNIHFYECDWQISIEELYQHFKNRYMIEK